MRSLRIGNKNNYYCHKINLQELDYILNFSTQFDMHIYDYNNLLFV